MNIFVCIVYCQQPLSAVQYVLRYAMTNNDSDFSTQELVFLSITRKREAERKNKLSLKRPFQQLSSVSNIFADYFCFVLCFYCFFWFFLGPYDHLHRRTRNHVPKSKLR